MNSLKEKITSQINNRNYNPTTVTIYTKYILGLATYYSTNNPEELSTDEIKKYILHQWKVVKKPANSINLMSSAFKLYFLEIHGKNIQFDSIEMPKKERAEIDLPTIEEIRLLFDSTHNLKRKTLLALSYGCGLETGELLNLKYEDIDQSRNLIFLKSNRKKPNRESYISPKLIELVNSYYKSYKPKTWLFESRVKGEKSPVKTIQAHVKEAAKDAGLKKALNFIILRYCYIKHMEDIGIPLSDILKKLNIKDSDSYRFYANLTENKSRNVENNRMSITPYDLLDNSHINASEKVVDEFWNIIHPKVKQLAKGKFENEYYSDSIETCLKELNSIIKEIVKEKTGREYDGSDLMARAFSPKEPIIELTNLTSESGQNIQKGYMQIYAGVMTGIRNPKTHQNITTDKNTAIHLLFVCSQLFYMLRI